MILQVPQEIIDEAIAKINALNDWPEDKWYPLGKENKWSLDVCTDDKGDHHAAIYPVVDIGNGYTAENTSDFYTLLE